MLQTKPKPSGIVAEARKIYIPYIENRMPEYPARSILVYDSAKIHIRSERKLKRIPRVVVIDKDPVDVVLNCYKYGRENGTVTLSALRMPVVNMASEKRAGGD